MRYCLGKPVGRSRGRIVAHMAALAATTSLAACQAPLSRSVLRGSDAYRVMPAVAPDAKLADYRIGPLDTLNVTVFQEPDVSLKDVKVDAGGQLVMPLIGKIPVTGRTAGELSGEIATLLTAKYLQNPQVSVTVVSSVSQRVAVEGSVNEAGVYEVQGATSLLEALAMAKGVSRTAALSQVVVFRTVQGQRNAAVFNIADIRRGASADPQVYGGDLVVVGFSNVKAGWRDFLSASPLLSIFRPF